MTDALGPTRFALFYYESENVSVFRRRFIPLFIREITNIKTFFMASTQSVFLLTLERCSETKNIRKNYLLTMRVLYPGTFLQNSVSKNYYPIFSQLALFPVQ